MADPEIKALSTEMLYLTWQLRQQAKHTFDALALTSLEGMILVLLSTGIDRPSTLVTELNVRWPRVSEQLSDLEAQGLVERHRDAQDGRVTHIQLTPKGHETVRTLLETWREDVRQDLMLTAEEYEAFEAWCKKLVSNAARA